MRYVNTSRIELHSPHNVTPRLKHVANIMQTQLTSETQSIVGEPRRHTSIWP